MTDENKLIETVGALFDEKIKEHEVREKENYEQFPPVGWHLKKEISVSVIISVVATAAAGLFAYTDLKRDIALLQADALSLHQSDTRMQDNNQDTLKSIDAQYQRLDSKLDRLIERQMK